MRPALLAQFLRAVRIVPDMRAFASVVVALMVCVGAATPQSYAAVRATVERSFPAKTHEMANAIDALQTASKQTITAIAAVNERCAK